MPADYTRRTSAIAYHRLVEEGILPRRRREVYDLVYRLGPGTSAEILKSTLGGVNVLTQGRARFTELRDMGLLVELGERPCTVTGHMAIVWDVTELEEPIPVERPATMREQRDALARLCEEIAVWLEGENRKAAAARIRVRVADVLRSSMYTFLAKRRYL